MGSADRFETSYLWLFEASVGTRLKVSEIAKYTLLELLHVADGAPKSLETEDKCPDNIRAGNMIETTPKDAGNVLLIRQQEPIEGRV